MNGEDLKRLRKAKNISLEELAIHTGIPRGTLGRIESSSDEIKKSKNEKILIDYFKNEISVEENTQSGEEKQHNILNINTKSLSNSEKNSINGYGKNEAKPIYQDVIEVPIIEKRARAGYVRGYADPEYMETLRKVYVAKQYEKGNYLVFEIDGNSMDDDSKKSICNGDAVLCKELDKFYWQKKLFQRVFIIITDEEVLCKQIIGHNVETGLITCHSFNQAYEDFELNLSEINQLFYLVRIVERNIEF